MEATPSPSVPPSSGPTGGLFLAATLLLLGIGAGWSLHRAVSPSPSAEEHEEAVTHQLVVTTAPVARGDFALADEFFGVVAPDTTSMRTVSSRAGGLVIALSAASGQEVNAGDVLLQFDAEPLDAAVLAARGTLAAARNQLAEFERSGKAQQTEALASEAAKAASDLQQATAEVQRLKPLCDDGLIAEKVLADAKFAMSKAQLDHDAAQRAVVAWQKSGAELQASTLTAAEAAAAAALHEAEVARNEASVKASAHGRLLSLTPKVGDKLEAGAALGALLVDDRRTLVFSASATASARYAPGAAVVFTDPLGKPRSGKVLRVAAAVGADGLVEITASVDGTAPLLTGAYVYGEVETEQLHDALLVPAAAVMRIEGEDHIVVRGEDGKSRKVEVEIRGRRGDQVAIEGKVAAGARLVVEGGYNLPDGTLLTEAPVAQKDPKQGSTDAEQHK